MALGKQQAKVTSFGTHKLGKNSVEKVKNKVIKVVETDGTIVKAAYGATVSKNYNSVRIDVGIEYPTTKDNTKQAFKDAWDLCGDEMAEQMEEANKFLRSMA